MQRLAIQPRRDWQHAVESVGLTFHTTDDGAPYWDESACYEFTSAEIDAIEKATYALNELCLQVVEHIVRHNLWDRFQIPPPFVDYLRHSWADEEITIVGRFDLLYDGVQPPKLLEYNADTPTALLEAAVVQWYWLQDVAPDHDQFNSLHERLIEVWKRVKDEIGGPVTFTSVKGHVEDYMTVTYLRDVAQQAGLTTQYLPMTSIGWSAVRGRFVDLHERPLGCVFKLYPWEWMLREKFATHLPGVVTRWLEPAWKVLLSNKAILPLLWELNPDHPNLLPASSAPLPGRCVRKPAQGREGANIAILDDGKAISTTDGDYAGDPVIYQQFVETPRFDGHTIVLGSWMVNGYACGLGIREDDGLITTNTSRFVPHRIAPTSGVIDP